MHYRVVKLPFLQPNHFLRLFEILHAYRQLTLKGLPRIDNQKRPIITAANGRLFGIIPSATTSLPREFQGNVGAHGRPRFSPLES